MTSPGFWVIHPGSGDEEESNLEIPMGTDKNKSPKSSSQRNRKGDLAKKILLLDNNSHTLTKHQALPHMLETNLKNRKTQQRNRSYKGKIKKCSLVLKNHNNQNENHTRQYQQWNEDSTGKNQWNWW